MDGPHILYSELTLIYLKWQRWRCVKVLIWVSRYSRNQEHAGYFGIMPNTSNDGHFPTVNLLYRTVLRVFKSYDTHITCLLNILNVRNTCLSSTAVHKMNVVKHFAIILYFIHSFLVHISQNLDIRKSCATHVHYKCTEITDNPNLIGRSTHLQICLFVLSVYHVLEI
jgi:hypothetical protein